MAEEPAGLCAAAQRIRQRSIELWGESKAVEIVGQSPEMVRLLERIEKIASYDEPLLILGDSGVGKESLAQAAYLLGPRTGHPFVSVNCPQYQEGNLTVSELFGHRRGSFTGAMSDRKGCFETADGGVIFLDEIGDLPMAAQLMLLRTLATGEFQPLGSDRTKQAHVRVVAATNRSLNQLAAERHFRRDLLFRLRYFRFELPRLAERGDDWRLILDHVLGRLYRRYGVAKRFSEAALRLMAGYEWPGNVRELISLATTGYALSDGDVIEPAAIKDLFEVDGEEGEIEGLGDVLRREGGFWERVQQPYLERDFNRREVRRLVGQGLREAGSYRDLLKLWKIPTGEYQKFMDFLRHHRLKPTDQGLEGQLQPMEP